MSEESSPEEIAAATRRAELDEAESGVRELLEQRGAIKVWEKMRDRIHCEAFLKSRTGGRIVSSLIGEVIGAQTLWLDSDDPCDPKCVAAHFAARAALISISAIDEILVDGTEAEEELRRIENELGDR